MTNINSSQYWTEVASLANQIAQDAMSQCDNDRSEAEELINDSLLDETIGAHQWVIYNAYHLDVYQYSDNSDYYIDNFGTDDAALILKERGLNSLHESIAFWALYADVREKITDALDGIEE